MVQSDRESWRAASVASSARKVPAGQIEQPIEEPSLYVPAGQTESQSAMESWREASVASSGRKVPPGQAVQEVAPKYPVELKEPEEQIEQPP